MASKGRVLSTVMLITILSKCLGFLRDMVLAYFFGAGAISDAYFVAQTIPEFLFSLAVQAISIGFIPIYMEIMHKKGREQAVRFTNNLSGFGLMLVVVLVVAVYAFTGEIVQMFASGFSDSAAQLAQVFVRISVWGMFFRVVSAIYTSFLNANERFTISSLTGIPLDLITISSVLLAYYLNVPEILALGIALGYLGQLLIQYPSVRRLKTPIRKKDISLSDPYLKKMVALFLPVAFGVGANQINILVDRTMASSIEGGISALNYANKVGNIFENIIVLSLATVIFPTLSKHAAQKKFDTLSTDVGKSLMLVILSMLPCAVFSFQYAQDAIQLLFGHGAFDARAIVLTTDAMRFYSIGLLFVSFNAILTRSLYSLSKVKFTSVSTFCAMLVNVALNIALAPIMGVRGIALATSVANIAQTIMLGTALYHQIGGRYIRFILKDATKCIIGVLCMIVISWGLNSLLGEYIPWLLSVMIAVAVSGAVYLILMIVFRVQLVSEALAGVRRTFFSKKA